MRTDVYYSWRPTDAEIAKERARIDGEVITAERRRLSEGWWVVRIDYEPHPAHV